MATFNVQTAVHATLAASVVDVVNLASYGRYIEIHNRGATNAIHVTLGAAGSAPDPTVGGDNTLIVVPSGSLRVPWPAAAGFSCQVKLISGGAQPFSVQVIGDRNL